MLNYISAVGIQPKISRCVGMADDADSKSVGCTPVRVQVPPPAVKKQDCCPAFFMHLIARHPCKQNYFDLTKMSVWHIIHLTREPKARCSLAAGKKICYKK